MLLAEKRKKKEAEKAAQQAFSSDLLTVTGT